MKQVRKLNSILNNEEFINLDVESQKAIIINSLNVTLLEILKKVYPSYFRTTPLNETYTNDALIEIIDNAPISDYSKNSIFYSISELMYNAICLMSKEEISFVPGRDVKFAPIFVYNTKDELIRIEGETQKNTASQAKGYVSFFENRFFEESRVR